MQMNLKVGAYWRLFSSASIVATVLLLYAPAIQFEYVWDDIALFFESDMLRNGWASVGNIFKPILPDTTYFRPAVLATFVLEFARHEADSKVSHGINVALHALNSVLVSALAQALLSATAARSSVRGRDLDLGVAVPAFLAGMLYAVHPALVEGVSWVAGRFDTMCASATFAVLLFAQRRDISCSTQAAICALTLLALLCKEMAITLPALVLLFRWAVDPHRCGTFGEFFSRHAPAVGAALLGVTAYIALRATLLPTFLHTDNAGLQVLGSKIAHLSLVASTLLFYLRWVMLPIGDLSPVHPIAYEALRSFSAANSLTLAGAISVIGFGGIALKRNSAPLVALATAFLVSLFPVLHIIPLTLGGNIGALRFLAIPLGLFCAMIAVALFRYGGWDRSNATLRQVLGLAACVAAFVYCHTLSRATMPIWQNDFTLFSRAVEVNPNDPNAGLLLLSAANNRVASGRAPPYVLDEAIQRFMRIDGLAEKFPERALPIVASSLATIGQEEAALFYAQKAREIKDAISRAQLFLVWADLEQNRGNREIAAEMIASAKQNLTEQQATHAVMFLLFAQTKQALLEDDSAALEVSLRRLRAQSSPRYFVESQRRLRQFRDKLCLDPAPSSAQTMRAICKSSI